MTFQSLNVKESLPKGQFVLKSLSSAGNLPGSTRLNLKEASLFQDLEVVVNGPHFNHPRSFLHY